MLTWIKTRHGRPTPISFLHLFFSGSNIVVTMYLWLYKNKRNHIGVHRRLDVCHVYELHSQQLTDLWVNCACLSFKRHGCDTIHFKPGILNSAHSIVCSEQDRIGEVTRQKLVELGHLFHRLHRRSCGKVWYIMYHACTRIVLRIVWYDRYTFPTLVSSLSEKKITLCRSWSFIYP